MARRKDYMTYGAALNGPLTVKYADGSFSEAGALTRRQLQSIIRKGQTKKTKQ